LPILEKSSESNGHQTVVTRHIWQADVEVVDHLIHQEEVKENLFEA
jgi:hypothetical protein